MEKLICSFMALLFIFISQAQNVGINTSTPSSKLEVNGTFRITDGTQGIGKVLTSDSTGLASWQPPPSDPAPVVWICCNLWMASNLDVSTYNNGDPIYHVTDPGEWGSLTFGAYCYYNNDSTTYAATYGKLYNWYAVNDPRGLAPVGWHIATYFEWKAAGECHGFVSESGITLKEAGTLHWTPPNTGATNSSGFTALPGGYRWADGPFSSIGNYGFWWSSTENDTISSWFRKLSYNTLGLDEGINNKNFGFSVRCVRD
jgi:uncharacterized protein (TIGR02145 family)